MYNGTSTLSPWRLINNHTLFTSVFQPFYHQKTRHTNNLRQSGIFRSKQERRERQFSGNLNGIIDRHGIHNKTHEICGLAVGMLEIRDES